MKRDLDLMRQIMLDLEANTSYIIDSLSLYPVNDREYQTKIYFHLRLLEDAGYIKLGDVAMMGGFPNVKIVFITNAGYDFLRLTRDDKLWKLAHPLILKAGAIASITAIEQIITNLLAK